MTAEQFRLAVLQNAIADIGKGEEGQNNWGPYVEGLLNGVGIDFPAAWCAAAVWSWIAHVPIFKMDDLWINSETPKIKSPSAKAMFNRCRDLGWLVDYPEVDPQPGDLIFFKRPGESWYAHVGIVRQFGWDDGGLLCNTIEGNKGPFPSKVAHYHYEVRIPDLLGFARLLNK